jgi:hypothetical protein
MATYMKVEIADKSESKCVGVEIVVETISKGNVTLNVELQSQCVESLT